MGIMKRIINRNKLRNSEKEWGLYRGDVDDIQIEYVFPFIDQINVVGHHDTVIRDGKLRSVVCINLNERITQESIMDVVEHEALHIAICTCIAINKKGAVLEKVIRDWMQGRKLIYVENRLKVIG